MITTRTPFRVSFFGGGTDYPGWYREHGGAVLATTIDKYCYLSCRNLPPFFDVRHRTVYNKIELTKNIASIEHPAVRACLDYARFYEHGSEIVHTADLPARTGLGSSSSFTVGLLQGLFGLQGKMPTKRQLAEMAIDVEQNVLRENVGSQDQVSAAFGGFNVIEFNATGFELRPVTLQMSRRQELEQSLILVYTGVSRFASEVAAHQVRNISKKQAQLHSMRAMVDQALAILTSDGPIEEFGKLLHESWRLKASLSDHVTTAAIDEIYDKARANGAIGGKLLGAGGGGFLLLFATPENRERVIASLSGLIHVPFRFETLGTQVIYFQNQT